MSTKTIVLDNTGGWRKAPNAIILGDSYLSYKEMVDFALEGDKTSEGSRDKSTIEEALKLSWESEPYIKMYTNYNYSDTTLGGNDAINPYWQFGVDDDIIHPITSLDGKGDNGNGMGRVYAEMYENNQQILWLQCGVPEFSGASFFLETGVDDDVGYANYGRSYLGNAIGKLVGKAFMFPFYPFIAPISLTEWLMKTSITKYYDFKPAMTQYYRAVNVIMTHMAINLGIYPANATEDTLKSQVGIPTILKNGPDIFSIMNKRALKLYGDTESNPKALNTILDKEDKAEKFKAEPGGEDPESGILSHLGKKLRDMYDAFSASMFGGTDFMAYRVERTTDANESISNSTKQSEMAAKLNEANATARSASFSTFEGKTGYAMIDEIVEGAKSTIKTVADKLGGGSLVTLATGNGYFNVPEIWDNSSFSKSYSFNIQLRARYGDPVSIYQSIMVPLATILAMALPRQIGQNMYTSPFMVRGYCKGLFAIPLGVVDSISIRRGQPEFGWALNNIPISVDINISIKDLSPAIFLSIGRTGFLDAITSPIATLRKLFRTNDDLEMYLSVLCGLGMIDILRQGRTLLKRINKTMMIHRNTTFSPIYYGTALAKSTLPQLVGLMLPWDKYPKKR